jgi:hypothetical protein
MLRVLVDRVLKEKDFALVIDEKFVGERLSVKGEQGELERFYIENLDLRLAVACDVYLPLVSDTSNRLSRVAHVGKASPYVVAEPFSCLDGSTEYVNEPMEV